MTEAIVTRVPIRSIDDPAFEQVARRVPTPPRDPGRESQFWPALSGFNIGSGTDVDISYLESTTKTPKASFDRHLHSEELFVCLEGDFVMPMATCRNPDDPEEIPHPEDLLCFHIKTGDMYVLKTNVWHNGGWPSQGTEKTRYIMVLSGHRSGEGHQGRVDHIEKRLPEGMLIQPEGLSG